MRNAWELGLCLFIVTLFLGPSIVGDHSSHLGSFIEIELEWLEDTGGDNRSCSGERLVTIRSSDHVALGID